MDADILSRLAENDAGAVDECFLYVKQWALKHTGSLQDAEDIAQETVVQAWRMRESYRGRSKVTTWLVGIAMNVLRNKLRREERHVPRAESIESADGDPAEDLDDETALLSRMEIETALASLTEEERGALLLTTVEELTSAEAGARLGRTANACRLAKARALRKLGEYRRKLGE